jgi:drug/metabolite transporter (DMT)-like permease
MPSGVPRSDDSSLGGRCTSMCTFGAVNLTLVNTRKRQSTPSHARFSLELLGLLDMVVACLCFTGMGACVFSITLIEPAVEAPVVSLIRAAVNLVMLLIPALMHRRALALFGDARPSLWLRGFFGGTSLILSFASIQRIGPGESGFLTSSSGIFVAALGPFVLHQKNRWFDWLAILTAFAGLYLLVDPSPKDPDLTGRLMGLLAGFLAALAYLMVSRSARSNTPSTVVFYFAFIALLLHILWFTFTGIHWPTSVEVWALTFSAGLLGSIAQFFLTRAYQRAPAARVSQVGYLTPVLGMILSIYGFDRTPPALALMGCGLILGAGVILPILRAGNAARGTLKPASARKRGSRRSGRRSRTG